MCEPVESSNSCSRASSAQAVYWENYLENAELCHFPQLTNDELPLPPSRQQVSVDIDSATRILKTFCRRNDVQAETVLKSAWAVALSLYTGNEEVGFAQFIFDDEGQRNSFCRVAVCEDSTLATIVETLDMDAVRGKKHWLESLEEIPKFCNQETRPLYNSGIVIHQDGEGWRSPESEFQPDVLLRMRTNGSAASLILEYSTSTLCDDQAANVASTVATIISAMAQNSTAPLHELDLFSPRDRRLLEEWNAVAPEPVNECAHTLIHRRSESQPSALAVDAWDGKLTYSELDQMSTRLAHHLRSLGVGPEIVVPLCFEKSTWAIVAMLGVIKAGGVMVFLDPQHPEARRRDVAEQVAAHVVVASKKCAPLWDSFDLQNIVTIDPHFIEQLPPKDEIPASGVKPDNALYVIFTSGSTGKPKGCVIQHYSFLTGAFQQGSGSHMGSSSRVLQLASYSFDVSILEILTSLIFGACVCTPLQEEMAQGIGSIINRMQITWAFLTPSLVKVISPSDVPSLKCLVLGGEALSKTDVETWGGKEELQTVNGYGPSECSVAAVANPRLKLTTNPANIGRGIGGLTWIVEADDHNKLIAVGRVGELLIEGPILSRGYLNNPEKTAESFVFPTWANNGSAIPRRFYKTGDLVRYNPDGSICFVGRKDTQVKLRGLRIELGEIEHHISVHPHIQHALVLLPKSGPCNQRLVAIVSLKQFAKQVEDLSPITGEQYSAASEQVSTVREHLAEHVPTYMVPETWFIVEGIPLMVSGKMNRKLAASWVAEMPDEAYSQIIGIKASPGDVDNTSPEARLRRIYSRVLNIPEDRIPLNRTFMAIGGDSISAMQVSARCRQEGLAVNVKDIIRSQGIIELARRAASAQKASVSKQELFDTDFDLSPVQRMYFDITSQVTGNDSHYNQSFFLRLTKSTDKREFEKAVEAVVSRHSMLRARFRKANQNMWKQRVLKEAVGTYRLITHNIESEKEVMPFVEKAQRSLSLFDGPVFSVDLFEVDNGSQLVFLVAHHAVIDLVSWRVIMKDLEEMLTLGQISAQNPLPWHAWLALQTEYANRYLQPQKVLPFTIPPPDYEYWGMGGKLNENKDCVEVRFFIDPETTREVLGDVPHRSLRTEPIDFLLASVIGSFCEVFNDRQAPALFREGHGRETWDDALDLSETVGWFTTMYPLYVDAQSARSISETVKFVKDVRRKIPRNGWPYFASRYLNPDGIKSFRNHSQVELSFDYLGLYQQLERVDSLLRQERRNHIPSSGDVGGDVHRFCLVEIIAEVKEGQMQFSFVYNRHMNHQERIKKWINRCRQWLYDMVLELSAKQPEYTLSDFPLSSLTYPGLEKLVSTVLPRIGAQSLDEVEDLYPCTSMQTGLLVSQNRFQGTYEYYHTFEITSQHHRINVHRIQDAWQQVVQRHSSLRTIFIDGLGENALYEQIVLKQGKGRVVHHKCKETDVENIFTSQQPISFCDTELPHRLTICEITVDKVLCKLEINHAIVDGESIPVILRDLSAAYDGRLPVEPGPLYSDIVAYQQERSLSIEDDLKYWKQYLAEIEPCYFPSIEDTLDEKQIGTTEFQIPLAVVQEFCTKSDITLSNLFQTAWGLVLRCYTGSDQVCFGYLTSGRDAPVTDINNAVGAYINMLVCRLNLGEGYALAGVLKTVQEDFVNSVDHQYCSLADIQHAIGLSSEALFNTVMTFRRNEFNDHYEESSIRVSGLKAYDPTEYVIDVDVWIAGDVATTTLEYMTSDISHSQAASVASAFRRVLEEIISTPSGKVSQVQLFSNPYDAAIMGRRDMQLRVNGRSIGLSQIESHVKANVEDKYYITVDVITTKHQFHSVKSLAIFLYPPNIEYGILDSSEELGSTDELISPMSDLEKSYLKDLRAKLKAALPSHMLPSLYIILRRVPFSSLGKIDRHRLRAIDLTMEEIQEYSLEDSSDSMSTALTNAEKQMQYLWSQSLGMDVLKIGVKDNFFHLGGDSVAAMKLVASARAAGMTLTVAIIFQNPVLSDMAEQATSHPSEVDTPLEPFALLKNAGLLDNLVRTAASQCDVTPAMVQDIYPASPLQEGLMSISTRKPGAYVARKVFLIPNSANFDLNLFKEAWRRTVELQPILRTRLIHTKEHGTLQVVLRTNCRWELASNLQAYLRQTEIDLVKYGGPLMWLAIVEEDKERYFVWTAHHAIYDGWSVDLLFNQIERTWANLVSLTPVINEPGSAPVFYSKFIQYLTKLDDVAAKKFWSEQLSGETPASFPRLPNRYCEPKPDQRETNSFTITRNSASNITSSTLLRTAWAMVVSRYSDSDDIVFCTTLSGRNAPVSGIDDMLGPMITTVPVRMRLDFHKSISEVLDIAQQQSTSMIPFEHVGLQKIRQYLGPSAQAALDLKHLFVVQPAVKETGFLEMQEVPHELKRFNTYALVVECFVNESYVDIKVEYDSRVLPTKQIQHIISQMEYVVHQLCAKSREATLGSIDIFSPRDSLQVQQWNSMSPQSIDECIHDIIKKQTLQKPYAMALDGWDGRLTYRQLDVLSSRLAQHLRTLGVKQEVFVPLCFDKSVWTVVSMLAVLKAGGAYVQLSPAHPVARIEGILAEVNATIVLISPKYRKMFEARVANIVAVQPSLLNSLPGVVGEITPVTRPENVAFVVYTSGSTGKPKGVMIEHRGLCTMIRAQGRMMKFSNKTRALQFASHTFDVSNCEVLTTLMHGGCVCIPSEHERMNKLASVINRLNVDWLFLTPTVASLLDPVAVPNLKYLALGGECIRQDLLDRWASSVCVLNSYGPSECSIWTSMAELHPGANPANIGHGLGCNMWITDTSDHNRLAPVGCIGELIVSGPIVSRGYVKSDMTAAFIEAPRWAPKKSDGKFYKTGDLVRYNLEDGTIKYIGRKDNQVKWHGQRIELGEIEQNIKTHWPAAQVAVDVFPQGGQADKPTIAVFLDVHGTSEVSSLEALPITDSLQTELQSLQRTLTESLPSYMVPSHYIILSKMATTMSGKTDRNALRLLASQLSEEQLSSYALATVTKREAATPTEKRLLDLWAETLSLSPSSLAADDNFFQVGGDSLYAMKLATAAREQGLQLRVADIMRYPKLSEMAEYATTVGRSSEPVSDSTSFDFLLGDSPPPEQTLETGTAHTPSPQLARHDQKEHDITNPPVTGTILPVVQSIGVKDITREVAALCKVPICDVQDVYPCTPLQAQLMNLTNQQGAYVAHIAFRLPKTLNIGRFQRAWQTLSELHSILRTRIVQLSSSAVVQAVIKEPLHWEVATGTLKKYTDQFQAIRYGDALSRFAIIRDESESQSYFVWSAQHSVYDGWSIGLLFTQLQDIYHDQKPQHSVPFKEFVQHLQSSDQKACDQFWLSQLGHGRPNHYPQQLPSLDYQPRQNQLINHRIDLSSRPKGSVTLPTVLQGAWAKVIARHLDSDDIVFGAPLSGRDTPVPGIEEIIGPTITTIPVRVQLDADQTVQTYLENLQIQRAETILHQHIGLEGITKLDIAPGAASFGHLFAVDSGAGSIPEILGLETVTAETEGFDNYALKVTCWVKGGKIIVEAYYDDNVFATSHIKTLLTHFENVVHQFVTKETLKLRDVDLFGECDIKLLKEWNRDFPEPVHDLLHHIIAKQVTLRPHAPAIDAWDGQATYHQLDEVTTRLANYLSSKYHITPNTMVPVCFDKSIWAVISMLAVIKAGGAIVPLNPEHPKSRLAGIVENVEARLIVVGVNHHDLVDGLVDEILEIDGTIVKNLLATPTPPQSPHNLSPEDACIIVFTSGSTGKPKGICLPHETICSSAHHHGKVMGFGPETRTLQFTGFTFDVAMAEIFTTLQYGGCICIPTEDERLDNLSGFIRRMNCNWSYLTPTVASLLRPQDAPSLRTLALGGEPITKDNIRTWSEHLNLIECYGPAETCIFSTMSCNVKPTDRASTIGRGVGSLSWIVDPEDHNRLCPIGCIGELLLEGPIVAKGYVKLPKQTATAFISDPKWPNGLGKGRRMYKTGDLAKFNWDGTMDIAGRKDTQVKLYGQRIEVAEIEHHLGVHEYVRSAAVTYVKPKKQLVATIALKAVPPERDNVIEEVGAEYRDIANKQLSEIRTYLSQRVPRFMVPVFWVAVTRIPLAPSGKTHRQELGRWLETWCEKSIVTENPRKDITTTIELSIENVLQHLVCKILDLPQVSMETSFLRQGGDSITAMQLMNACRKAGLQTTTQEIIRSESISQLAATVKTITDTTLVSTSYNEELGTNFPLSPIQQLYFDLMPDGSAPNKYLHQGFLLRLKQQTVPEQLERAFGAVVDRHSMLRARFQKTEDGWMQKITGDVNGSFKFGTHELTKREQVTPLMVANHIHLDITNGPLSAVDLVNLREDNGHQQQLLFVVFHHLIIDVVSWGIVIRDLETFLSSGSLSIPKPLSFQQWHRLQVEQAKHLTPKSLAIPQIPPADMAYWEMDGIPNIWRDAEEVTFHLNEVDTTNLFGASNEALQTEPVDIIVASLIQGFSRIFVDRPVPAIYSEGHGREPWSPEIDVSDTVGWFTTMSPIHVSPAKHNILDTVRRTKDSRRNAKDHGFSYFTSRYLNDEGKKEFCHHFDMEILFNYLGRNQQLENTESFFSLEPLLDVERNLDAGPKMRRIGLLEVTASVVSGRTQVVFSYNCHMKHIDKISAWAVETKRTLKSVCETLSSLRRELTMSDLPLLSVNYSQVAQLNQILSDLALTPSDIEDIYPLAPLQSRMILYQQQKSPTAYLVQNVYDVVPTTTINNLVDVSKLQSAWQQVVNRHPVLRTIFIPHMSRPNEFYQVVKRKNTARVLRIEGDSEEFQLINSGLELDTTAFKPHNRLTIQKRDSGEVSVKLEVNHALIDGISVRIIMRDLALAYENKLPIGAGPLFSDYVKMLLERPRDAEIMYCDSYVGSLQPCHFPAPTSVQSPGRTQRVIEVPFEQDFTQLYKFSQQYNITLATIFQTVWGLVLRYYTGSDMPCYGYLTAGRDLSLASIDEAVGTYINLLVCRLDVGQKTGLELLEFTRDEYLQSLPHQHGLVDALLKTPPPSHESYFNTIMSLQYYGSGEASGTHKITFNYVEGQDPNEYDLSVAIGISDSKIRAGLAYWAISDNDDVEASKVAETFVNIMSWLLENPTEEVTNYLPLETPRAVSPWEVVDSTATTLVPSTPPTPLAPVSYIPSPGLKREAMYMPPTPRSLAVPPTPTLALPGTPRSPHRPPMLRSISYNAKNLGEEALSSPLSPRTPRTPYSCRKANFNRSSIMFDLPGRWVD